MEKSDKMNSRIHQIIHHIEERLLNQGSSKRKRWLLLKYSWLKFKCFLFAVPEVGRYKTGLLQNRLYAPEWLDFTRDDKTRIGIVVLTPNTIKI